MSNDRDKPQRSHELLQETRRRVNRLEMETHRLKANLARCEATEEDAVAARLGQRFIEPSAAGDADHEVSVLCGSASSDSDVVDGVVDHGLNKSVLEQAPGVLPSESPPAIPADLPAVRRASEGRRRRSSSGKKRVDGGRRSLPANGTKRPVSAKADRARPKKKLRLGRPERIGNSPDQQRDVKLRSMPAWLLSMLFHGLMLSLLALFTLATLPEERPMLMASMEDLAEHEELIEVEVKPQVSVEPVVDTVAFEPQSHKSQSHELESHNLVEVSLDDLASVDHGAPTSIDIPWGDLLMESSGRGAGKSDGEGAGGNQRGSASFFGNKSRADRILFLVDNSNSMKDGRFETALLELGRSVGLLSAKQSFYVMFYSDTAYRMFHPQPTLQLVPATKQNKQKLHNWLGSVEMCQGGQLVDAMQIVDQLKPQVVYLLSDGEIGNYPMSHMTGEADDRSYSIHTVGMTVASEDAGHNLVAIAETNRGTFRPTGVAPIARQMSRRRPIKKNRSRGQVWGINLPEQ